LTGRGAVYSDLSPLTPVEALRLLRTLHAKRAEQKGILSTFDSDPVQQFHERLLQSLPREQLMMRCLRSGSDIFAMFYGFRLADRLFSPVFHTPVVRAAHGDSSGVRGAAWLWR